MSASPPSDSITASPLAPPSPFACSWKPDGVDSAWVHVGGELDLSTLRLFRETLHDAQLNARSVSIDLQGLEFIDCSGLGTIVAAQARARREGGRLNLVRGSGQVDRVLALTGLLEEIETAGLR